MTGRKRFAAAFLSAALILTMTIPAPAATPGIPDAAAEAEEIIVTGEEIQSGILAEEAIEAEQEPVRMSETGMGLSEGTGDGLLSDGKVPLYETEVPFDGASWMKDLSDSMPLSKITVPGTHDSGTFNIRFGIANKLTDGLVDDIEGWIVDHLPDNSFLTNFATRALEFIAGGAVLAAVNEIVELVQRLAGRCQSLSIKEQLKQGVRAFDLRYRYEDGKFNVYHGDMSGIGGFFVNCECYDERGARLTLQKVFSDIQQFLSEEEHKNETVFVTLKNEGGVYDRDTEVKLYTMEKMYGVDMRFAKRDHTAYARQSIEGITEDAPYYDVNDAGNTLGKFRRRILDVSGSLTKAVTSSDVKKETGGKTGDEWVVTCDQKVRLFGNSLLSPKNKLEERQTNVQVKFIIGLDPMDECEFNIKLTMKSVRLFWFLPEILLPTGFSVDVDSLLKTPLANAENINPRVKARLNNYAKNSGHEGNGLGIISSDFVKEDLARAVANVNRTTGYGPVYTESATEASNSKMLGSGDEGGAAPDWQKEYEELEAVTSIDVDFSGSYQLITENGYTEHRVSYDTDGNLIYETTGDAVKMINICMDGESIPLDYIHVYAPVTKEYPQARITVYKSYLEKLAPGTHSFVVFFTDGSEAAPVVIAGRTAAKEESAAFFTGTWEKPVTGGRWYTDPAGNWHYENNGVFRNTWGYITNPDAGGKAQWFLFGKGGELLSGWQPVNGKWYYLNPNHDGSFGACFLGPGRTPDGYEVDASGAWTGR